MKYSKIQKSKNLSRVLWGFLALTATIVFAVGCQDVPPDTKVVCNDCDCDGVAVQPPENVGPAAATAPFGGFVIDSVKLTYLKIDNADVVLYVDHPLHFTVGLTGESDEPFNVNVIVGMVEKVAADAGDDAAVVTNAAVCVVGSVVVEHSGSGQALHTDSLLIPPECLPEGKTSVDYNFWASIDQEHIVMEQNVGAEDDNVGFYTRRDAAGETSLFCMGYGIDLDNNESAADYDNPVTGCVYDVNVTPSPGVGIQIKSLALESSVGVLWSPESVTDGTSEPANIKLDLAVVGFGVNQENTLENTWAKVSFDIIAASARSTDPVDIGAVPDDADWMPVVLFKKGYKTRDTIRELTPNTPLESSYDLFLKGDTFDKIETGAWADQDLFTLRACVYMEHQVDSPHLGILSDDPADNCRLINVTLIEDTPTPNDASSYSFNKYWGQSYGSMSSVLVGIETSTANVLDTNGAHTDSYAKAYINGLLGYLELLKIWANGDAYVSISGSNIDLGVSVFTINLYSYYRNFSDYTYNYNWNVNRSQSMRFSYGIYILTVNVEVGLTGEMGFNTGFHLYAGERYSHGATRRTGVLNPYFSPYSTIWGSVEAYVSVEVARAGAGGYINLFSVDVPLNGELEWWVTRWSGPFQMPLEATVTLDINITTLDGYIELFADVRNVEWCDGLYFPYPCGFVWDRVASYRLATWAGYQWSYNLLTQGPYNYTVQF
jgi:hypothetical protein